MRFAEKSLYCVECKKYFIYSVYEQEFRDSRGYFNDPVRCAPCRKARKSYSPPVENASRTTAHSNKYFS
jgi:hypothetical protein